MSHDGGGDFFHASYTVDGFTSAIGAMSVTLIPAGFVSVLASMMDT